MGKHIRTIGIAEGPMDFGTFDRTFDVNVGCQNFNFRSVESLLGFLSEYIAEPDKVESDYYKRLYEKFPDRRPGIMRDPSEFFATDTTIGSVATDRTGFFGSRSGRIESDNINRKEVERATVGHE
jgi:hypothetical protein